MALPQYSSFMRLPLRGYPGAGLWKDCQQSTQNPIYRKRGCVVPQSSDLRLTPELSR
jgi:hypothetical protein